MEKSKKIFRKTLNKTKEDNREHQHLVFLSNCILKLKKRV